MDMLDEGRQGSNRTDMLTKSDLPPEAFPTRKLFSGRTTSRWNPAEGNFNG